VEQLYARYGAWLRQRLRRRFGSLEGDDIGQDAWLRVAALDDVDRIRHPKAFLLRVATNIALMQARHRRVVERRSSEGADEDRTEADQLEAVVLKELILSLPQPLRELGVRDRFDPAENLLGGADYLARQLARFGDVRLALAAYNSGPARVARLGRVPSIPETEQYVATVVECFLALTAGRDVRSSQTCRHPETRP